jgi:hypothetical protein
MLPEDRTSHVCLNDGFDTGNNSCICKDSNYIEGNNCQTWKCINFGRGAYRPDAASNDFKYCDCPPGFRGLHCEPTACIPNSDGFIKAFNPVERSFTIIVTYNDDFKAVIARGDAIITSIITMLTTPPFSNSIDRLHAVFIGSTSFDPYSFDCKKSDGLSACFSEGVNNLDQWFGPFPDQKLTSSIMLSAIQDAATHSSVLLVTNVPIFDYANDTQINLIAQTAVARQIELDVLLVEPLNSQGQNIYFSEKYIPLIDLTHKTLGTFIDAYELNGGPNAVVKADEIIPQLGPIIATKTLVDFGTWKSSNVVTFNVLSIGDTRDIYVAVAANKPSLPNMTATVISLPAGYVNFTLVLDAGIWKLFKYSNVPTSFGYQIMYTVSEECTYHIWTVSQTDTFETQPHTFIAFLTDSTSDANYPIAIKSSGAVDIPNTIVGHIYNANPGQTIVATISLGNVTLTDVAATSRNCLFDLQFSSIVCKTSRDYGTIQIKITNGPSYFQEILPIICGTPEETQVFSIAPNSVFLKRDKASENDITSIENDAATCAPDTDRITLDPTAKKSFVFAFPNYASLTTKILFNGQLGNFTIIRLLLKYINSYGPLGTDYFENFVLAPYNVTAPNVESSAVYTDFQSKLIEAYGNTSAIDPASPSDLDQGFVFDSLINFPLISSFSEIFIITNKPYFSAITIAEMHKSLASKRIKLNFLIYDDGMFQGFNNTALLSTFYDLAARSGGNVVLMDNKKAIEDFFLNYCGLQKSQNVISSFDPTKEFAGLASAGDFNFVQGGSYYIAASVKDGGSAPPFVQLQGPTTFQINATAVIGKYYALFFVPNNTAPGRYSVNVFSGDLAPFYYLNVVEVNPKDFYVIAFSTKQIYDVENAYPNYSGAGSRVYIVANVPNQIQSDVTITYPYNQEFSYGKMESRDSCKYNLISIDTWQCKVPNELYYVTLDTAAATHTAMFPCFKNNQSDTGSCQNGGTQNSNGICVCPPGFEGPNCGDPKCYNGGTIQPNNTCRCTKFYSGDHCEIATFSCQKSIPFPRFASVMETFVLVIDLNAFPLHYVMDIPIESIPTVFQQYILVTAFQNNNADDAKVQVYSNVEYFHEALLKVTHATYPIDSRVAIRRGLEAVKTDRALLIWISGSTVLCGQDSQDPQPDDGLLNLIAKRKVELRAFTAESVPSLCNQLISSYGNGAPFTYRNIQDVFSYVNLLVPTTVSDVTEPNKNLAVIDSYITNDCGSMTVNLAIDDLVFDQYTYFHVIVFNLKPNDTTALGDRNIPDVFDVLKKTFTLIPNGANKFCGYIVEALHPYRIAYEVTPSNNFEAEGYGVFYMSEQTNLNIYFENGLKNVKSFDDFPEVFTANVEYTNFTFEHAPVIQRNCTYLWSVEVECNGFSGALKTKLIMKDSAGDSHQRLITTYCIKKMSCGTYGTPLLADDKDDDNGISHKVWTCGCNPLWSGTDCSIPVCLNGGTPNRESCNCPGSYYGSNCEIQVEAPLNFRLLLIILDVTGTDDQLAARKELLTEFLKMYSGDFKNNYIFTTNVDGGATVAQTGDASQVQTAVNQAVLSNKTIDLEQAFDYFNTKATPVQINAMFYITDSSIDPEMDLSSLSELQEKGIYLYSAYYYNDTDPSIPKLADLSGLGGTTGAWNIYDVLSDFTKFAQGGNLTVVPTPPATTTVRPTPCVHDKVMDITIFFDSVVSTINNYGGFFALKAFVIQLANDIKFATIADKQGSRVAFAVINKTPGNLLCLSSAASLEDGASNTNPDMQNGLNLINLNRTLMLTDGLMGAEAEDVRTVPKFAVIITDRSNVDNLAATITAANQIKTNSHINFVLIGYGGGNFQTDYSQFIDRNFIFTLNDDQPSSLTALQQKFYQSICQKAGNFQGSDYNYLCPQSRKIWY